MNKEESKKFNRSFLFSMIISIGVGLIFYKFFSFSQESFVIIVIVMFSYMMLTAEIGNIKFPIDKVCSCKKKKKKK